MTPGSEAQRCHSAVLLLLLIPLLPYGFPMPDGITMATKNQRNQRALRSHRWEDPSAVTPPAFRSSAHTWGSWASDEFFPEIQQGTYWINSSVDPGLASYRCYHDPTAGSTVCGGCRRDELLLYHLRQVTHLLNPSQLTIWCPNAGQKPSFKWSEDSTDDGCHR